MAKDAAQTIRESRRAAMAFLDSAKEREKARNNRAGAASQAERTKAFNERNNARDARRTARENPVEDFLRAGKVREARRNGQETDFELAQKIRSMSDEQFDDAVKSGYLTPEQIRKAGEYEYDIYMGDVWSENADNDLLPEPTYDEFVADPQKYGVPYTDEDAARDPDSDMYPVNWGRYNPARFSNK